MQKDLIKLFYTTLMEPEADVLETCSLSHYRCSRSREEGTNLASRLQLEGVKEGAVYVSQSLDDNGEEDMCLSGYGYEWTVLC